MVSGVNTTKVQVHLRDDLSVLFIFDVDVAYTIIEEAGSPGKYVSLSIRGSTLTNDPYKTRPGLRKSESTIVNFARKKGLEKVARHYRNEGYVVFEESV